MLQLKRVRKTYHTGNFAQSALANGVNAYIRGAAENTLSLYPLTIQTQGIDLSAILTGGGAASSPDTPTSSE